MTDVLVESATKYSFGFCVADVNIDMACNITALGKAIVAAYLFRDNDGVTIDALPTRNGSSAGCELLFDSGVVTSMGHRLVVFGFTNPAVGNFPVRIQEHVANKVTAGVRVILAGDIDPADTFGVVSSQVHVSGAYAAPNRTPSSALHGLVFSLLAINGYDPTFTDVHAAAITPGAGQDNPVLLDVEGASGDGLGGGNAPTVNNPRIVITTKASAAVTTAVSYAFGSGAQPMYYHVGFEVRFGAAADPPVAGFTTDVDQKTVTVTDTSVAGTNPISSALYDWGDGSAPDAGPSHTYLDGGTFTIEQTVSDGSLNDTVQHDITTATRHTYRVTTVPGGSYAEVNVDRPDA